VVEHWHDESIEYQKSAGGKATAKGNSIIFILGCASRDGDCAELFNHPLKHYWGATTRLLGEEGTPVWQSAAPAPIAGLVALRQKF